MTPDEALSLADYRRRVSGLYAQVREQREADPHAAFAHWRAGRDDLFANHTQSALDAARREGFRGLNYYDYDPRFAVRSRIDGNVAAERFDVATSSGSTVAFVRIGRVTLPWGQLDLFWLDAYGGGLFLPFRDATAGDTTYGGGRYLLDTVKGADLGSTRDELTLDFNFAYHPSCHYNAEWACPLAPPDNRLDVRIEAGEQTFG